LRLAFLTTPRNSDTFQRVMCLSSSPLNIRAKLKEPTLNEKLYLQGCVPFFQNCAVKRKVNLSLLKENIRQQFLGIFNDYNFIHT